MDLIGSTIIVRCIGWLGGLYTYLKEVIRMAFDIRILNNEKQ